MIDTTLITERMEVVGSDGKHVGRVDHLQGAQIELTKLDFQAMGKHHMIPLSWIDHIDDKVHLSLDRAETERRWVELH